MLVLQYYHRFAQSSLQPVVCHYRFYEDTPTRHNRWTRVQEFLRKNKPERMIGVLFYVRAPKCDAAPEIQNRFAFTNVWIMRTDTIPLHEAATTNAKILARLQQTPGINADLLQRLATIVMTPEKLTRMGNLLWWHVHQQLAARYYHPDYIWRTGKKKGQSHMQYLLTSSSPQGVDRQRDACHILDRHIGAGDTVRVL